MSLDNILDNLQKECNKLYEEYGASDDVIQLQVAINNLRNTFDIPDESQMTVSNEIKYLRKQLIN